MADVTDLETETGVERAPDESLREYVRRLGARADLPAARLDPLVEALEGATAGPDDDLPPEADRLRAALVRRISADGEADVTGDGARATADGEAATDTDSGATSAGSTDATGDPTSGQSSVAARDGGSDASGEPLTRGATAPPREHAARSDRTSATPEPGDSTAADATAWPSVDLPFDPDALSPRATPSVVDRLVPYVWVLSALALLPTLLTPVPAHLYARREIGGYFTALAFARDPLGSLGTVSLYESPLGLDVHALLWAPFAAAGVPEAGRLLSFAAAVAATVLLVGLADRLWDRTAALLAGVAFWANPVVARLAWTAVPETLSIALTVGVVAVAVRDPGDWRWTAAALAALVLAVANQLWTVAIVLPASLAYLHREERARAAAVAGVGGAAALLTGLVVAAQPIPVRLVDLTLLGGVRAAAWVDFLAPRLGGAAAPYFVAQGYLLVAAGVALGYWAWRYRTAPTRTALLLTAWLEAGVLVPLLVPGVTVSSGGYALWGLVAPVTLTVAWVGARAHRRFEAHTTRRVATRAVYGVVAVLVAVAALNGLVVEAGLLADTPDRLPDQRVRAAPFGDPAGATTAAGVAVRDYDVDTAAELAFVGDWTTGQYAPTHGAARVLVYSGASANGFWTLRPGAHAPAFVDSARAANGCTVRVVRTADGVEVEPC